MTDHHDTTRDGATTRTDATTREHATTRIDATNRPTSTGRRAFLASAGAIGAAGLGGCLGLLDDDGERFNWIGSGPGARPATEGTPMADLPELEGELTVYSGRGRFLVQELVDDLDDHYEDFTADVRYGGNADLANQIQTEGSGTNADVFYSATAGPLSTLADAGLTGSLSSDTLEMVPEEFRTDDWVGTGGRVRSIPYNTNALDESDLPDAIADYPDLDADMGWAPSYTACQEFLTAMRVLEGDQATREWVEGVVDAGIAQYADEQLVCQAVADGEIDLGFTNHYYVQRVRASRTDPPLSTAFTAGDAGATFNLAGAAVVDETDEPELADLFVRHLLSAEAQIYFAERTYEYPLVPEVQPAGDLPPIDELSVPEIDLSELRDLSGTVELMRDAGVDV